MKVQHILALCAVLSVSEGALRAQVTFNAQPTRVLGQPSLAFGGLNWVEGRELRDPGAVALDATANPPILYVCDTGNNRVLAWRDAYSFTNGAKADLVIGQLDFRSTSQNQPTASFRSGLALPVSVAVDRFGHLWVADAGNNRVVRYKRPFEQETEPRVDFVVGQSSLTGRTAGRSNRQIALSPNNSPLFAAIAFDAEGNLWLTDAGNNRVLRFPAAGVSGDATQLGPSADLVLGQPGFDTATLAPFGNRTQRAAAIVNKTLIRAGNALAFDSAGRLFVADDLNRVLVFVPPFSNGMAAARIMGVASNQEAFFKTILGPNDLDNYRFGGIGGLFVVDDAVFVVSRFFSRILRFPRVDAWAIETLAAFSPAAEAVIGQGAFDIFDPNRGVTREPAANSLNFPLLAAVAPNREVFIADAGNHRVVVYPDLSKGPEFSDEAPYSAIRLLGQVDWPLRSPNLIEGREFAPTSLSVPFSSNQFLNVTVAPAVAIDRRSDPPRLYVSDPLNNRILGYADARRAKQGQFADLVIGQVDFYRAQFNSPNNSGSSPSATGLSAPGAIAVDPEGNLWIADTANSRVVRYPRPFDNPAGPHQADIVIGQESLTSRATEISSRSVFFPSGIAFTTEGHLVVSDLYWNRVLLFQAPFSSGMEATTVFGQDDFVSAVAGNSNVRFSLPRGVAVDADDRLYVADLGNNRVQIFERVTAQVSGTPAVFSLRVANGVTGVTLDPGNGEIWITERGRNAVARYPSFFDLLVSLTPETPNLLLAASGSALNVALDTAGNPIITDAGNRLVYHFPALTVLNAANRFQRVAPGMVGLVRMEGTGPKLVDSSVVTQDSWWPRELADIQITVDDQPAPLYAVNDRNLTFQVPRSVTVPQISTVEIVRASTGQVLASGLFRADVASPALFTTNNEGTGNISALNKSNGQLNSTTNPVRPGEVITLYLTGQGFFDNMPEDGQPAPEGTTVDTTGLRVNINGRDAEVRFSGMAANEVGKWQIDAVVPTGAFGVVPVIVIYKGFASNLNPVTGARISTTIAVAQP